MNWPIQYNAIKSLSDREISIGHHIDMLAVTLSILLLCCHTYYISYVCNSTLLSYWCYMFLMMHTEYVSHKTNCSNTLWCLPNCLFIAIFGVLLHVYLVSIYTISYKRVYLHPFKVWSIILGKLAELSSLAAKAAFPCI